jgi:hypothetical protein
MEPSFNKYKIHIAIEIRLLIVGYVLQIFLHLK